MPVRVLAVEVNSLLMILWKVYSVSFVRYTDIQHGGTYSGIHDGVLGVI